MKLPFSRAATAAINYTLSFCFAVSMLSLPAFTQDSASTTVATTVPGLNPLKGEAVKFQAADSGALAAIGPQGKQLGKCPLKHTSVTARISGYVARVTVKQLFENPFKEKIEAVYTFPLSETGAVDDMLMKVGTRTIHGTIKRKEEAREIYETAKTHGQVASLLDQERNNIFTQSVANIKPGEKVEITLQYVDLLPYEDGAFSFAFPTVVGPRFNPGDPAGKQGTGWSPDTTQVPDGSRITPPVTAKGTRAGHDISIDVSIDAGVPIQTVASRLHDVSVSRPGTQQAVVSLKNKTTIPNKDFVLQWAVASDKLQSGYLTHRAGGSGYFTLMLLPPKRVTPDTVAPKEMVFLIDCSGSQSGAPLEKAKETLNYIVDNMNPQDTFQIISFNNRATSLFSKPQPASASMRQQAKAFIKGLTANGGTWMAPAVEAACAIPADAHRLRIVTFMTDGYVGNDFEIIGMVKKLRGKSRWFPFGTGNSVNRMLIDGMAKEGGGEAEYVLLNKPGIEVAKKFYERISSPVLTDVKVDFEGVEVKEVFPHQVSDVWAQRPLYIKGRYTKPGKGTVTLSGYAGGKPYTQKLDVTFPEKQADNAVLGSIWARAKVDRLMSEDYMGAQQGSVNKELKEEIVKVALAHHIMTQYTSFVAVEERVITDGGKPRTVAVPVEMPDGVSYEGVFGEKKEMVLPMASGGYGGGSGGRMMARSRHSGGFVGASPPPPSVAQSFAAMPKSREQSRVFGDESLRAAGKAEPETAAVHKNKVDRPTEEDRFRTAHLSDKDTANLKLHPSLRGLAARLQKLGSNARIDGIEIRNGKVTVQIRLKHYSASAIQQLKLAGLEIVSQAGSGKTVIGRITPAGLERLARLDVVRLIEPPKTLR